MTKNLRAVNSFTDLTQYDGGYLHDHFDMHYNCVDELPVYVSEDWSLIISADYDELMSGNISCWDFEWAVISDENFFWSTIYGKRMPEVDGFLAEYYLSSPWEAFRVAMRYRDAYLAGKDDEYQMI